MSSWREDFLIRCSRTFWSIFQYYTFLLSSKWSGKISIVIILEKADGSMLLNQDTQYIREAYLKKEQIFSYDEFPQNLPFQLIHLY